LFLCRQVAGSGIDAAQAVQNSSTNTVAGVAFKLHTLGRVKLGNGINQTEAPVANKVIDFHVRGKVFANRKATRFTRGSISNSNRWPLLGLLRMPVRRSPNTRNPEWPGVECPDDARWALLPCCLVARKWESLGLPSETSFAFDEPLPGRRVMTSGFVQAAASNTSPTVWSQRLRASFAAFSLETLALSLEFAKKGPLGRREDNQEYSKGQDPA